MEPTPSSTRRHLSIRSRTVVRRAVGVGIGLLIFIDLMDEVRMGMRRVRGRMTGWWGGVERHERRQMRTAGVEYLVHVLRPR